MSANDTFMMAIWALTGPFHTITVSVSTSAPALSQHSFSEDLNLHRFVGRAFLLRVSLKLEDHFASAIAAGTLQGYTQIL